jgi:hypothetical protein
MPVMRHECLMWVMVVSWLSIATTYSALPLPC